MKNIEIVEFPLREDERGWVAWPIPDRDLQAVRISNFHVPSLKPGAVRGNHYHMRSTEFAFMLSGPCRAVFLDNATGQRQEVFVEEQKPVLFKIKPNTTHAFKNEGRQPIFLICYVKRTGHRAGEDSFRKEIL